jgi:hypothetical protein
MRRVFIFLALSQGVLLSVTAAKADRENERRSDADYVLSGKVTCVYACESTGYRHYIVEIMIEDVDKGPGLRKGGTFRAYCYQRKPGFDGLEYDTTGHTLVPKAGQRVKMFVNGLRGRNEGVYPDWVDVIEESAEKGLKPAQRR